MMRLGILCSSREEANLESKVIASSVIQNLIREKDYEYVMGAGSTGMMHMCQELLIENGVSLEIVGMRGTEDLEKSLATYKVQVKDTYERTKQIYQDSDAFLFLSGGFGTMAELYSMIDANIEMGLTKSIMVYNADHSYDLFIADINQKIRNGFAGESLLKAFNVIESEEQLFETLDSCEKTKRKDR